MDGKELVVEVTLKVVVRVAAEAFHKDFRAEVGEVAMDWAGVLREQQQWDALVDAVKVIAVEDGP